MRALILVLLLTGCAFGDAKGPIFSNPEDSSVIIYNNDHGKTLLGQDKKWSIPISINGKECTLHYNGYIAIDSLPSIRIEASQPLIPGTSSIILNNIKDIVYVGVVYDQDKLRAQEMLGFIGASIAEANSENSGPFVFSKIPKEQAIIDLKGKKQDCI